MVRVSYSDGQIQDYATVQEAEADVLEVFAGSEGDITPVGLSEVGDRGEHVRDLSCEWKVHIVQA